MLEDVLEDDDEEVVEDDVLDEVEEVVELDVVEELDDELVVEEEEDVEGGASVDVVEDVEEEELELETVVCWLVVVLAALELIARYPPTAATTITTTTAAMIVVLTALRRLGATKCLRPRRPVVPAMLSKGMHAFGCLYDFPPRGRRRDREVRPARRLRVSRNPARASKIYRQ